MKIVVTVRELFDRGIWTEACDLLGTSSWAVNEGQMDYEDEVTLTEAQAAQLRLVPRLPYTSEMHHVPAGPEGPAFQVEIRTYSDGQIESRLPEDTDA